MTDATDSPDVLILGAGPAGMAAAMVLQRADKRVTLIEKAEQIGGLAKTITIEQPEGTYRTDIGPHRFYSKNSYLYEFIEDLLGEEWKKVPRHTRFFVRGKFYHYPIRLRNVLSQIGMIRAFCILRDYLWERIRRYVHPRKIVSFEDYTLEQFGRTLAEFNMLNYTEKIWGIPCNQISIDWAKQRIGELSVWAALKKMLFKKKTGPKTLVDSFYYPSKGSGLIYEAIAERIRSKQNVILTQTEPTKIHWEGSRITSVDVQGPQGTRTYRAPCVVSSVPVNAVIDLFDPAPPSAVVHAAKNLRFRAQVYLFLTVKREQVIPDNWVYFPDKDILFGRISEMKNFSKEMAPKGYTSLFIEFFCNQGDSIWTATKDDLFHKTMDSLEQLKMLDRRDVTSVHHFRQTAVYPLYDLEYKQNVDVLLEWFDRFENYYAIGRPGRFRYTNQDHSLEMGILTAQSILDGKRRNIDEVASEKEYFERGFVPEQK